MFDLKRIVKHPDFWFFGLLLVALVPSLVVSGLYDKEIYAYFSSFEADFFTRVTDQSVFNGDMLGVSDIPIFANLALILASVIYRSNRILVFITKYCITVNLIFGAFVVHGLKIVWGRARPYMVDRDLNLFTDFFEPGFFRPLIHNYSGSFPSGHTAAMMSFLPIFFCFFPVVCKKAANISFEAFCWPNIKRYVYLSLIVGGGFIMALGRLMSGDHYLSDCIAAVIFACIFHTFCFYFYFAVPDKLDAKIYGFPTRKVLIVCGACSAVLAFLYVLKLGLA